MEGLLPCAGLSDAGSAVERNQATAAREKTAVGHNAALSIDSIPTELRRTSIVCTVGPTTSSVEMLTEFRRAGMEVMRLNFTHGSYEFHEQAITSLRKSCEEYPGAPIAVAVDLLGPAIRTGALTSEVHFEKGDMVMFHTNPYWADKGTKYDIFIDYAQLTEAVYEGCRIFIDDGRLCFEVITVLERVVHAVCLYGGTLYDRRGVNIPGVSLKRAVVNEKDKLDIQWAVDQGVDFIFISFVQEAKDVVAVRELLREKGRDIKLVAKIENYRGVVNIAGIIAEADGIMVGRGDLGTELPIEKVFVAQKLMAAQCNLAGKPVMCASQMLRSMCHSPRPTRAEVSDVANAVLDGFDVVMLSAETAEGQYALEAVQMMAKIVLEAEAACLYQPNSEEIASLADVATMTPSETIALSATEVAYSEKAGLIVVMTASGTTARLVSKYRPRCPIVCVTRDPKVARQVQVYRGVYPIIYDKPPKDNLQDETDARTLFALKESLAAGYVRVGDPVVATQGSADVGGATNTVRVLVVPPEAAIPDHDQD